MKSLMAIFLVISVLFSFELTAQKKKPGSSKEPPKRKILVIKIGEPISNPDGTVDQETMEIDVTDDLDKLIIDKMTKKLETMVKEEKKGTRADAAELSSLAYDFKFYSYHPQIEETTEIYKSWFVDVSKIVSFVAMAKTRYKVEKFSMDEKQKTQLIKSYNNAFKKLEALLEKPKKIPPEVLKQRRLKKKNKRSRK